MVTLGWVVFGVVWGLSALGIVLNAIDLKRYSKVSMALYLLLGWCVVLTGKQAITAMGIPCFLYMLAGGLSYTIGALFYAIGGKRAHPIPYMHAVFHIFVVIGSSLHFVGIFLYIL